MKKYNRNKNSYFATVFNDGNGCWVVKGWGGYIKVKFNITSWSMKSAWNWYINKYMIGDSIDVNDGVVYKNFPASVFEVPSSDDFTPILGGIK